MSKTKKEKLQKKLKELKRELHEKVDFEKAKVRDLTKGDYQMVPRDSRQFETVMDQLRQEDTPNKDYIMRNMEGTFVNMHTFDGINSFGEIWAYFREDPTGSSEVIRIV